MSKYEIPEAALKAAAWEISAVDYPNYEPDLDIARKVLEAALPHLCPPSSQVATQAARLRATLDERLGRDHA